MSEIYQLLLFLNISAIVDGVGTVYNVFVCGFKVEANLRAKKEMEKWGIFIWFIIVTPRTMFFLTVIALLLSAVDCILHIDDDVINLYKVFVYMIGGIKHFMGLAHTFHATNEIYWRKFGNVINKLQQTSYITFEKGEDNERTEKNG